MSAKTHQTVFSPPCSGALVHNSVVEDGVVFENEKCTVRGCLYETTFRVASSPVREPWQDRYWERGMLR